MAWRQGNAAMTKQVDCPKDGVQVSPYLLRPLRSFAEASRDVSAKREALRRAAAANGNAPMHVVSVGGALGRGRLISTTAQSD